MKWLIGVLGLLALPGAGVGVILGLHGIASELILWLPLLGGFLLGAFVIHYFMYDLRGLTTFEHEFTHAFVALLFLRRIDRFHSTSRQGGYVQHSGSFGGDFGDMMIGLAPYYLPTITLLSVLPRPFLPPGAFPYYDIWIGFTLGFHTVTTIEETRRNWNTRYFPLAGNGEMVQSDLGSRGLLFSGILILALSLIVHGLIFVITSLGYPGVGLWFTSFWHWTEWVVVMITDGASWLIRTIPGLLR